MTLTPLRSGHSVGYDAATREMQIRFPDGSRYSYPHTCACVHKGIVGAFQAGLLIAKLPKGKQL